MSEQIETIWVAEARSRRCYHTDKDCKSGGNRLVEVRKSRFENLELCERCEKGTEAIDFSQNAMSKRPCPFCGEEVSHLPYHLPECDES